VDVVNHLNRGHQLVTDVEDRLRFSQLNCLAALHVKDTTAFRNALTLTLYGTIFLAPARDIVPYADAAETKSNSSNQNRESKQDSRDSLDDIESIGSGSDSGGSANSLRRKAVAVEEGALSIIPRSDQDYDSVIYPTVWTTVGKRLLALRLYLLRLELEYFIGNQSEGDEFMKVAMSRSIDGVERARLLGTHFV
jgi:hypothetical protein